jgi:hypothetical protein
MSNEVIRQDHSVAGNAGADEVSLVERYRAASSELNQRINARQISYLGHATACSLILSIFAKEFENLDSTKGSVSLTSPHDILLFLGPAVISIAFGCWIRSQDLTVGMLSTFCRICEDRGRKANPYIPSWHARDQGWQVTSMKHREWTEIAFVLLNSLLAGIVTLYGIEAWEWKPAATIVLSMNHFVLGLSSWMVLSIGEYRRRLLWARLEDGKLIEPPEVSPHPIGLMASVATIAVFGAISAWLLKVEFRNYFHSSLPSLIMLAFAVGIRVVVLRRKSWMGRKLYLGSQRPKRSWLWRFGLTRILLAGASILLLCLGGTVDPTMFRVAAWISAIFLGYGVPEFLLYEYRFIQWHRIVREGRVKESSTS